MTLITTSYIADTIIEITLNNPQKRNALSLDMLIHLNETFTKLAHDTQCRCVILSANGPVFCSGHDLKEIHAMRQKNDKGKAFFHQVFSTCITLMQNIIRLPVPVIACVQGTATAAGCQLVATCDLAFASTNAQFATPGVNIGLFCSTPMVALSRTIKQKHVMDMLLTGDLLSAQDALQYGLINAICPPQELKDTIVKKATKIVQKPHHTIKIGKEAFYKQLDMSLNDAYTYTGQIMLDNLLHQEAIEGIQNFIDKKKQ